MVILNPHVRTDVCIDDEGITWIRGHYVENSTEARALKAAAALANVPSGLPWGQKRPA